MTVNHYHKIASEKSFVHFKSFLKFKQIIRNPVITNAHCPQLGTVYSVFGYRTYVLYHVKYPLDLGLTFSISEI